ncbi:MAG: 50S ribosomal protein L33 [Candidatus Hydrogenedentota bacterium]
MASKGKGNREIIILECTEAPGTSRYSTMKNIRTSTERLELKKYNRKLRKHTVHREKKK